MVIELRSLILSVITAIVIPVIVSWYSSDLRVAQMQKKRDHNLELVKSLEEWSELMHHYTPITMPSPMTNAFTPPKPKPLSDLSYHNQFIEHMESGYPDLWAEWEKLSSGIIEHTNAHAQLLNDIASKLEGIGNEFGVPAIFPYSEKVRPKFYINVDKMAKRVFEETRFRLEGYPDWRNTEPKYTDQTTDSDGVEWHRWDAWGETILTHGNIEEGSQVIEGFMSVVDEGVFYERIRDIIAKSVEWGKESSHFKTLIDHETEKVILGEDMEGKCAICSKFGVISRLTARARNGKAI